MTGLSLETESLVFCINLSFQPSPAPKGGCTRGARRGCPLGGLPFSETLCKRHELEGLLGLGTVLGRPVTQDPEGTLYSTP